MFCSRKMNENFNYIHKRALRIVYDDYNTYFRDLLKKDNSLSIHHHNIQKMAIEMFKVKNNLCPELVQSLFLKIESRTKSNATFHRPDVNSVYNGEYSLRSFGRIVWNTMIPENINFLPNHFKKYISEWVPDNCPCRLCKDFIPNLGFITFY